MDKRDYVLILIIILAVLSGIAEYIQMRKMKVDIRALKTQQAAQSGVLDAQLLWNKTSTAHDILMDDRLDVLEQKMRKVYGGYSNVVYTLPREGAKEAGLILGLKSGTGQLEWVKQKGGL